MDTTPYLTPTVRGIINEIRQKQDYSLLPYLADALQDADFVDYDYTFVGGNPHVFIQSILEFLRVPEVQIAHAYRAICTILGGEYAKSLQWMDAFAKKMEDAANESAYGNANNYKMDYHTLMAVTEQFLIRGDWETGPGYSWQDMFEENASEFWKHYEVVTGKSVDEFKKEENFFSCSC